MCSPLGYQSRALRLPCDPGKNQFVGGLVDIFLFRRRRDPTLEPGPGASPRPELWFCPSPGTPDWKSLANPATFAMLANDCDALQLYQDQLLDAPMPPLGYCVGDAGCVCAICCAIAGRASASAAQAISRDLVRIAPRRRTLGHRHLDRVGRLFLRNRGKEIERANNDDEQDDEHR